jgi:LCP family protein required for cell wall assembly
MMKRPLLGLLLALSTASLLFCGWIRRPAFAGGGGEDYENEVTTADAIEPDYEEDLPSPAQSAGAQDGVTEPSNPQESGVPSTLAVPTPPFTQTTNILLVGIDRRPNQKRGGRPDAIVIAAISDKTGHLGVISVPRDLYVDIPGWGVDRINSTYSAARKQRLPQLDLLARVLSDTLHVPIHHKLSVDLSGFERLIDVIGGVEVDVPCAIVDDFVDARSESGRRILRVDAGRQSLDGIHAALYVRSRHGRSDWSRARRGQAVLIGIKERFASLGGLSTFPRFYGELSSMVESDLSRIEVLDLVRKAGGIDRTKVHGLVLGVKEASPFVTETGRAVLMPHPEAIQRALQDLFSAKGPGVLPEGARCFAPDVALRKN